MYLFLVFILLINIFLMCKIIFFILEFLLINFSNKLYNRIPNDENGWNFEIIEQENDIKLNDFTFIDDKLD